MFVLNLEGKTAINLNNYTGFQCRLSALKYFGDTQKSSWLQQLAAGQRVVKNFNLK